MTERVKRLDMIVPIVSNGRLLIPAVIRKQMGIQDQSLVNLKFEDGQLFITTIDDESPQQENAPSNTKIPI